MAGRKTPIFTRPSLRAGVGVTRLRSRTAGRRFQEQLLRYLGTIYHDRSGLMVTDQAFHKIQDSAEDLRRSRTGRERRDAIRRSSKTDHSILPKLQLSDQVDVGRHSIRGELSVQCRSGIPARPLHVLWSDPGDKDVDREAVLSLGLGSIALVLSVQFPGIGNYWYLLTVISPLAGWYYWSRANREEEVRIVIHLSRLHLSLCLQIKVKVVTSDDERVTDIIVEGDEEELDRFCKELNLQEKGKVYIKGIIEQ